jgi:hypothetical protein
MDLINKIHNAVLFIRRCMKELDIRAGCLITSLLLSDFLSSINIKNEIIDGYLVIDDRYMIHTWINVNLDGINEILDVTDCSGHHNEACTISAHGISCCRLYRTTRSLTPNMISLEDTPEEIEEQLELQMYIDVVLCDQSKAYEMCIKRLNKNQRDKNLKASWLILYCAFIQWCNSNDMNIKILGCRTTEELKTLWTT